MLLSTEWEVHCQIVGYTQYFLERSPAKKRKYNMNNI